MSFHKIKKIGLAALLLIMLLIIGFAARVRSDVAEPVHDFVRVDLPALEQLRRAEAELRDARNYFELYRRRARVTPYDALGPWDQLETFLTQLDRDNDDSRGLEAAVRGGKNALNTYIEHENPSSKTAVNDALTELRRALRELEHATTLSVTSEQLDIIASLVLNAENGYHRYAGRERMRLDTSFTHIKDALDHLRQADFSFGKALQSDDGKAGHGTVTQAKAFRASLIRYADEERFDPSGTTLGELEGFVDNAWQRVDQSLERLNHDVRASAATAQTNLLATLGRHLNMFLLLAAAGVVLSIGVSWVLSLLLSKRVESLAHGARELSKGTLSYRFETSTDDELGELTNTFNDMARSLETKDAQLRANVDDLARQKKLFEAIFHRVPDAMLLLDKKSRMQACNTGFQKTFGYTQKEILGRAPSLLLAGTAKNDVDTRTITDSNVRAKRSVEIKFKRSNGEVFPAEISTGAIDSGSGGGFIAVIRDISRRERANARIRQLAYFDPLTDLPNRALFSERLRASLEHAKQRNRTLAILYLDLDGFKRVNDTMGHGEGDKLLKIVAKRLANSVRSERVSVKSVDGLVDQASEKHQPTVARFGGDEFVILLPHSPEQSYLTSIAERINELLAEPIKLDPAEVVVSASIGIVNYPDHGENAQTLIKNADIAMYHAKSHGRNNYKLYSNALDVQASARLDTEMRLRKALERDELFLMYQPKTDLQRNEPVGVEALVRWKDPERGVITPDQFIPVAEDSGLIVPLGEWVLREACRQAKAWTKIGMPSVRVAVNVSYQQFLQNTFIDSVDNALAACSLQPEHLELELTEGVLAEDTEHTLTILNELQRRGIVVSVDDFGTGYSSLSYLKRFPLDVLKIDQSFIRDLHRDKDNRAITDAIISMAHSLNLRVVAEGVDRAEHIDYLLAAGCDEIQGYYLSPPVYATEVPTTLDTLRARLSKHRFEHQSDTAGVYLNSVEEQA